MVFDLHNGMSDIILAGKQLGYKAVRIAVNFYCVCDCVCFNMQTVLLGRVQVGCKGFRNKN